MPYLTFTARRSLFYFTRPLTFPCAGAVDESRLTGEAMPQSKAKGDPISSGSVVAAGYLEVTCAKAAGESFQARVPDS